MVSINRSLAILFLLEILNSVSNAGNINEFVFDRVEALNGTYLEGIYNISEMRIGKFNRTTYVLTFEIEVFVEMNQKDTEVEVTFYYNRMNNNQYNKSPINIKRVSLCTLFDRFGSIIFPKAMETHSNFPGLKGNPCPITPVRYFTLN